MMICKLCKKEVRTETEYIREMCKKCQKKGYTWRTMVDKLWKDYYNLATLKRR